MNCGWQLFDLVLAVDLSFSFALLQELLLLHLIDELDADWVKFTSLPVGLGCLSTSDLIVQANFVIMVLQVSIRDHVVVSLVTHLDRLASQSL